MSFSWSSYNSTGDFSRLIFGTWKKAAICCLLPACLACFALPVNAQGWESSLYHLKGKTDTSSNFYQDAFLQDFSFAGYNRGEKSLPSGYKFQVDVTRPPYNADNTGVQDATLNIQRAIDDAAKKETGATIYLPAGKYRLSVVKDKEYCLHIDSSNLILRGAGTGKTFLFNASIEMRGKSIIAVKGGDSWNKVSSTPVKLSKDMLTPSRIIPLNSVDGFKAGDLVIIRNYINDDWIGKHRMSEYWAGKGESLGGLMYCREVVAVNKATREITVDIPVRYALELAHGASVLPAPRMKKGIGLEAFSIGNQENNNNSDWTEESYTKAGNGSYTSHDSWAISMSLVTDSWIRNVSSYHPESNVTAAHLLSNGIKISQSKNVSVVSCSFGYPQFGGGGGNGYMYRIMANETLLEDCIADFNRHGFVLSGMSASGNVFHRCIDRNSGRQTGAGQSEKTSGSGSDHHMHFSQSNLFDQCMVENSYFAAGWRKWGGGTIHGLTGTHSVYWNLTSNGGQAEAVQTQQWRYGYVIGTSGDKPGVKTTPWAPGTEKITEPVDHVEGIGLGASLLPQSLFQDQKRRRFSRIASNNLY